MRRLLISCLFFYTGYCAACPDALPTNDPGFCASFKSVATCYCTSSGMPNGMCQDTNAVYNRMLSMFGSLQRACEYQKYTSTQNCIDNWTCFLNGGVDSQGRTCSGTGAACS